MLRGLDFIVLCERYPPFLRENAPKWEKSAHKTTPTSLLYQGILAALGGAMGILSGGRTLVYAMLEVLSK